MDSVWKRIYRTYNQPTVKLRIALISVWFLDELFFFTLFLLSFSSNVLTFLQINNALLTLIKYKKRAEIKKVPNNVIVIRWSNNTAYNKKSDVIQTEVLPHERKNFSLQKLFLSCPLSKKVNRVFPLYPLRWERSVSLQITVLFVGCNWNSFFI